MENKVIRKKVLKRGTEFMEQRKFSVTPQYSMNYLLGLYSCRLTN